MFSQSNHVNLKDAKETSTQDYEFFTSPEKVKNLHTDLTFLEQVERIDDKSNV